MHFLLRHTHTHTQEVNTFLYPLYAMLYYTYHSTIVFGIFFIYVTIL